MKSITDACVNKKELIWHLIASEPLIHIFVNRNQFLVFPSFKMIQISFEGQSIDKCSSKNNLWRVGSYKHSLACGMNCSECLTETWRLTSKAHFSSSFFLSFAFVMFKKRRKKTFFSSYFTVSSAHRVCLCLYCKLAVFYSRKRQGRSEMSRSTERGEQ